jgi:predicted CoA-binding protein
VSLQDTIVKILKETRTIAMPGASPKPERPSYGVMRFLQAEGYTVIPINPGQAGKTINGALVYASLIEARAMAGPIDMVDIFRRSEEAGAVMDEAIAIGAKFIWTQLGVVDHEAARRAEAAGLLVVMDRCPAIEIPRLRPRLA